MNDRDDRLRQLEERERQILTKMEKVFPLAASNDLTSLERKAHKDGNEELLELLRDLKAVQEELKVRRGF